MADLSLKIAVKLLTKNFHQGVNTLKGSLRSLQMQFFALSSALGAGSIGFANLISRMRDTAKETAQVQVALKNVSGSTAAFAENQKWLLSVAKKYGVQINTLTSGFTKFKAAADIANMSADDQRKIFESVSRASVAYALSAEDQRGVFMALSQMMSKGKVMAEELRLQMAERLPVAIQAMAKAMGVSVNQMDAMMKQGKVLSSEVLPKFAEALTEMTPNIDLDNLNKSLSDLSNSFVRLTEAFDIEGKYKAIVDKLGGALSWLADHADKVATAIRIAFEGLVAFKGFKIFAGFAAETEKSVSAAQRLMDNLTKKVADESEKQKRVASAKADYEAALNAESALTVEATEAQKTKAHKHTTNTFNALKKRELDYEKSVEARKRVESKITNETRKNAALSEASVMQKAFNGVAITLGKLKSAVAAFGSTIGFSALILGAYKFITHLISINRQAKELSKNLQEIKDRWKDAATGQNDPTISNLKKYREILTSIGKYSADQKTGALKEVNTLLGTSFNLLGNELGVQLEIVDAIDKQIQLLRNRNELATIDQELAGIREKKKEYDSKNLPAKVAAYQNLNRTPWYLDLGIRGFVANAVYGKSYNQWQHLKGLSSTEKELEKRRNELLEKNVEIVGSKGAGKTTAGGGGGFIDEESPLAKAQKSYTEALNELTAQAQAGLITDRELERKKRDAIEKAYIEAVSSGDGGVLGSSWFKELEQSFGSFAHGDLRKRQEDAEDMLAEYTDGLRELMRQNEAGALSAEEYRDAVRELATAFYREAGALDLSKLPQWLASEIGIARVGAQVTSRSNVTPYTPLKKNHRTWEMSDVDIAAEKLAEQENYLRYLQDTAKSVAGDMTAEINAQLAKVDSLEKALQLEEAKEAVEELSKSLARGGLDLIPDTISNIDNMVSAAKRLSDVLDDTDASNWEKIVASAEFMSSLVDGIMEFASAIEMMVEMTKRLTQATEVQSQIENAATQQKVANTSVEMAASAAQASQEVADAGTVVGAKTSEAIATGTAQGAKAGWPALLWAIPAALAAVMAGLAMMPKFAKGGVVGGNSKHGDKVLARLNSGEGVLTEQGMANLAGLAGAKATNVNVTGRLKAHGRDLVVVLEQEKRFQRRIG